MDTPDSWYSKANEMVKAGNNEDAIIAYEKAIELNPAHTSAWNNKGIILFRLKRYDEAISCYDKAIEINPNHANAWLNKAKAVRGLAQSYLDKANNDKANAAKLINQSLVLFDSADQCFSKGEALSENSP